MTTTKLKVVKALVAIAFINIILYLIWTMNYSKAGGVLLVSTSGFPSPNSEVPSAPTIFRNVDGTAVDLDAVRLENDTSLLSLPTNILNMVLKSLNLTSVSGGTNGTSLTDIVKGFVGLNKVKVDDVKVDDDKVEVASTTPTFNTTTRYATTVGPSVCRKNHTWDQLIKSGLDKRLRRDLNIFLEPDWREYPANLNKKLPFGLNGVSESTIDRVINSLPVTGLPEHIKKLDCIRCVVVAHGSVLRGKYFGKTIDEYDVVFRMNQAPRSGYEKLIGTKSTFRISYPEGAPQTHSYYNKDNIFVAVLFKQDDLLWMERVSKKNKNMTGLHFWKSIANSLPHNASMIRILNPALLYEAAYSAMPAIKEKFNNRPTIGTMALTLALHMCDEVSVAGMGYSLKVSTLEYYYGNDKMKNAYKRHSHNVTREEMFRSELKKFDVLTDLTGGIQ